MNGFFQYKDVNKFTVVPTTKAQDQELVHYLIERQNSRLKINYVRAYRGAECGSVVIYIKTDIKNRKKNKEYKVIEVEKYNIKFLKRESTQYLYKLKLATKLH